GGNSLLAAIYSGQVAARAISELAENNELPDFNEYITEQEGKLSGQISSQSPFSAVYIRYEIAKLMNDCLGITRSEEKLLEGIQSVDYYLSVSEKLTYDSDVSPYIGYSLRPMLLLARAILTSALERKETRGAHIRSDYPERSDEFALCSLCEYQNGEHRISYVKEDQL
ncbi:MAG: FAD-binding protein, partial [Oscillospiraceae bacterium]|nr:FAD-binding protein [Oscillospiraceae bacterium]